MKIKDSINGQIITIILLITFYLFSATKIQAQDINSEIEQYIVKECQSYTGRSKAKIRLTVNALKSTGMLPINEIEDRSKSERKKIYKFYALKCIEDKW